MKNRADIVLNEHLWAVTPQAFDGLRGALRSIEGGAALGTLRREVEGAPFLVEGVGETRKPYASDTRRATSGQTKAVLVVPVQGVIYPRGSNDLMSLFGGVSLQATMSLLRRAVHDPNVGSIIADFDSPGGMVAGVPEAAAEIRSLRGLKPMTAVANFQAASAAYYLASQFDEVVASPSSSLGSIGVVAQYLSEGKKLEAEGYQVQTLKYPDKKAEADGVSPLSSEAVAYRLDQIKRVYNDFVAAVVRGRRVPRATVEADFGGGRSLDAEQAVKVHLADRLGSFDSVLADHMSGKARRGGAFQSHVAVANQRAVELPKPRRTLADLRLRWGLN